MIKIFVFFIIIILIIVGLIFNVIIISNVENLIKDVLIQIVHFHIIKFNNYFILVDIRVNFVNHIKILEKIIQWNLYVHMGNFVHLLMMILKYQCN